MNVYKFTTLFGVCPWQLIPGWISCRNVQFIPTYVAKIEDTGWSWNTCYAWAGGTCFGAPAESFNKN
jgi:hypothetical protein